MTPSTIQISENARAALDALTAKTGQTPTEVLDQALAAYRRQVLRTDPQACAETEKEREALDAALNDGLEYLKGVRFVAPSSSLEIAFADGTFLLPIDRLELPSGMIDWQSARASSNGEQMTVHEIGGDEIPVDSATLRYLVDPQYAAKIDDSIRSLHMTPEEQAESARLSILTRDPRWQDVGNE